MLGAEIGADVYIVGAIGAGYLGPAQLVAWVCAGVMTALIVLGFMQCALIYPEVGGTYAYVRQAFGPLAGFTAGWALYLGETVLLPVFPTLAAIRLASRNPDSRLGIPGLFVWLWLGSLGGLYLAAQAPNDLKLVGLAGVALGLGAYGARLAFMRSRSLRAIRPLR